MFTGPSNFEFPCSLQHASNWTGSNHGYTKEVSIGADSLVKGVVASRVSPGHSPCLSLDRLKGKHFSVKKPPRKRCAVCATKKSSMVKKKDKKTVNYCEKCKVYLCIGRCFQRYHSLVKYWPETLILWHWIT